MSYQRNTALEDHEPDVIQQLNGANDETVAADSEEQFLSPQRPTDEEREFCDRDLEEADQELPRHEADDRLSKTHSSNTSVFTSILGTTTSFARSSSLAESNSARIPLLRARNRKADADIATTHVSIHGQTDKDVISDDSEYLPTISGKPPTRIPRPTQPSKTVFHLMWEEPDPTFEPVSTASSVTGDKSLDRVKFKLAEWSLAREQNEADAISIPSSSHARTKEGLSSDTSTRGSDITLEDDDPPTPPNTRKASGMISRSDSAFFCSPLGSSKAAPALDSEEQSYNDNSAPHNFSNLSRQIASLAEEEKYLKKHRDSLDLAHERLEGDKHTKSNPLLSASRDSMIITKQRFDRYPRLHVASDPRGGHVKIGALSPILDASPPDVHSYYSGMGKQRRHLARRPIPEIGGHSENDDDCAICKVERPRSTRSKEMEKDW
ncbi:hypothetical protein BDV97DRAFT_420510 [Delphinella strobiligena]|nr:hypothetical protein BDV97DRAFT_420510 [Delphinella strobiligena]